MKYAIFAFTFLCFSGCAAVLQGVANGLANYGRVAQHNQQVQYEQNYYDNLESQREEQERHLATQAEVQDALSPVTGVGSVQVRGHFKSNGTYVAPHTRTRPDGLKYNNLRR